MVDDFRVVLRTDAGEELALGLGNAQSLECRLDLLGDVIPGLLFALGGLAVVHDLVEVDVAEIAAPLRHRPLKKVVIGPQPELEHPLRLVLERADLLDRVARKAALRLGEVDDVVLEVELRSVVIDELASCGHCTPGRSPCLRGWSWEWIQ